MQKFTNTNGTTVYFERLKINGQSRDVVHTKTKLLFDATPEKIDTLIRNGSLSPII